MTSAEDDQYMDQAIAAAETVRGMTAPNPWVGCVVVAQDGSVFTGATQPNHGRHAEDVALEQAGEAARGATLYATLEPCSFVGQNPACVDAILAAGISRVVAGIQDPDPRAAGRGFDMLSSGGVEVTSGVRADEVRRQLAPYFKHRTTGRPYVILKMAMTMDGRTAAPDSTSQWITGAEAREDVHRLRAECDAIVVGSGTVHYDNPSLTVRLPGSSEADNPRRVVLGHAPPDAKIHPALIWDGNAESLLDHLGADGCLQLLVEGGSKVAGQWHRAGLIDRYVLYMAPAALGGNDGIPLFGGQGISTMADVWRGRLVDATVFGEDVRIRIDAPTPALT